VVITFFGQDGYLKFLYFFVTVSSTDIIKNLQEVLLGQHAVDWNCVVKKMLIIIPESVNSPPTLTEPEHGSLEQTNLTVRQFNARSGREKREYSVPIYKLTSVDVSILLLLNTSMFLTKS